MTREALSARRMILLAACLALGGCNAARSSAPAMAAEVAPAGDPQPAPEIALPAGAPCTAAIDRWRAVISSDYRMGYSDAKIYSAVQKDIAQAQDACAAGQDGEALQIVAASRRRHGYPPN